MKRKFAMLLAVLLAFGVLGGCVVYPPGASSRARRQAEKLEERIEREMDRLEERLEGLDDLPELDGRVNKVEVYDANSGALLGSLESQSDIKAFEDALSGNRDLNVRDLQGVFAKPEGNPEYRFEVYTASVGEWDRGELYKVMTLTTYSGISTVHLEVSAVLVRPVIAVNAELRQASVDALRALAEQVE